MTYAFGAGVRLDTTVTNTSGTPADPVSIEVSILLPDGTVSGPHTPVHDGTGLYHYDYLPAQAGRYIARWVTATPTGADEEAFDVAPLWGEAGVLSLREAKKQLNIDADDTTDDDEIQGYIRSITRPCERVVGSLVRRTVVEKHEGGYAVALNAPPVLEVVSVEAILTGGDGQDVADLDVDGPTGIVQRTDGCYMRGPLRWTYTAGRTEILAHVNLAARIILQHLWDTQRGTMGGGRGFANDEVWDPRFGFSIPRRAQELLGDQPPGIA
ncbi:hypothetical protein [Nonomuraea gerenzanensis]|uniref:Uncharacterized protein n=1 Tax=Nonomuraea gerenzanensis TaxID=93944 RepID=A0A1M4BKV9_9ACTN|nr:hypothetical protein [Nonomuraea gerenzanensis]UBU10032.1 hypothetical protein LCN96_37525 [Nonomuraea gerenzanensis]SAP16259.1 hypothetical protein BN4615_P10922 [Nonomuraea gerenzanensis]